MSDPSVTVPSVPSVEVGDLLHRLDHGEPMTLLDVRNDDEFNSWKVEALKPVETVHVPYFDFIEDAERSIGSVPAGRPVIVLCAQGGSSEMVVDMLKEAGIPARNVQGGMVAYGEYLQPVRVPLEERETRRFEIWQINRRGKGCLSYVVRSRDQAAVVDPARDAAWYEAFVASLGARIVHVLDTHIHADHVIVGPALSSRLGVPYSVSAGDEFELRHQVEALLDGQLLTIGGDEGVTIEVRIISTPGHTPGSTSFLVGGRYLLTGDTIFVTSIGRPDLGGHVVEWGHMLFDTLHRRVATLPDDIVVLPAHYSGIHEIDEAGVVSGRLGELRGSVPELQIPTADEFVESVRLAVKEPPASYAEIIKVNLGLASAEPEKISEWELGKNECAAKHR